MIKINLGSGTNYKNGWINVDIRPEVYPDVVWDLKKLPYPWSNNLVDEVLLENTIEHISYLLHDDIFKELHRIMKRGAFLEIICPDVQVLYEKYIHELGDPEAHAKFEHFLFGGQINDHDYHKAGYTCELLHYRLTKAGFSVQSIIPGMVVEAVKL